VPAEARAFAARGLFPTGRRHKASDDCPAPPTAAVAADLAARILEALHTGPLRGCGAGRAAARPAGRDLEQALTSLLAGDRIGAGPHGCFAVE
jgi:hypothetical protein